MSYDSKFQNFFMLLIAVGSLSFPVIYIMYKEKSPEKIASRVNFYLDNSQSLLQINQNSSLRQRIAKKIYLLTNATINSKLSKLVKNRMKSSQFDKEINIRNPNLDPKISILHSNMNHHIIDNNEIIKKNFNILSQNTNILKYHVNQAFQNHLSHQAPKNLHLEQYMHFLSLSPSCKNKPIFMTMARVSSDLYWQLIENFFHSMYHFGHLDCAVMVCVSDQECMKRCKQQNFPCFDFQYLKPDASTFEQVGAVKIFHVAKALALGVHILLLDLDVGFLKDPLILFEGFLDNPYEQVRSQMDVGNSQYKGTLIWFSFPRPNFGLFLIKSHPMSIKLFQRAWKEYSKIKDKDKVAADQSVIVGCVKWARWRWGYNFSYFDLGYMLHTYPRPIHFDKLVVLLDKIEFVSKRGIYFELGGKAARNELSKAIAVHATCYEKSTKLMALKASNAFWNIDYYDPNRRTLTKPLMLHTIKQLRREIHSLAQLAILTNRSLIIPNILIGVGINIPNNIKLNKNLKKRLIDLTKKKYRKPYHLYLDQKKLLENAKWDMNIISNQSHAAKYKGEFYWPAFRTALNNVIDLEVVEAGYYYRLLSDFQSTVPEPTLVRFNEKIEINQLIKNNSNSNSKYNKDISAFNILLEKIKTLYHQPRLVIDLQDDNIGAWGPPDLISWAADSISQWGSSSFIDKKSYVVMPYPKVIRLDIIKNLPLCKTFMYEPHGNRTCFEKCM